MNFRIEIKRPIFSNIYDLPCESGKFEKKKNHLNSPGAFIYIILKLVSKQFQLCGWVLWYVFRLSGGTANWHYIRSTELQEFRFISCRMIFCVYLCVVYPMNRQTENGFCFPDDVPWTNFPQQIHKREHPPEAVFKQT